MKVRQLPGSKGNFWLGVTTPDSVRVTTGTGIQIYFQPGGLKTTANPDGTGIDVRAAGGFLMAPGSRHPNGFYPVRARRLGVCRNETVFYQESTTYRLCIARK